LLILFLPLIIIAAKGQVHIEVTPSSPFEKQLPELSRPAEDMVYDPEYVNLKKGEKLLQDHQQGSKTFVYQPKEAFKLVVTKRKYPKILPGKDIQGVVSLRITPDYLATSEVIFQRKPYRFDRLSWAIKTGWNDTIPYFSRLSSFKKYLKPFDVPVYAHFYIRGVKEYPEYPGQYYHWPREALEDYYLYILEKIDTVASQN
jgi:hypothetical protein